MSRPFKGKTTTKSFRLYELFLLPAEFKHGKKLNKMVNEFFDHLTSIKEKQDYFNNQTHE